jgi:hypothetical protein
MNCTLCEHRNDPERNYCGACGSPLARYCGHCGFRNAAADRYCGGCGAVLEELTVKRAAEGDPPKPATQVPGPTQSPPDAAVAELLEAAQEGAEQEPDDAELRVSQGDIDSLFGG